MIKKQDKFEFSVNNFLFDCKAWDAISSESDSLAELPLPQITDSDEIPTLPMNEYKKNTKYSGASKKIIEKPKEEKSALIAFQKNKGYISDSKIITKIRHGGSNIVKEVRTNSGNSYLARKQRYLETMQENGFRPTCKTPDKNLEKRFYIITPELKTRKLK